MERSNGPAASAEELYAKFTLATAVLFIGFELAYFLSVPSLSLLGPSIDTSG